MADQDILDITPPAGVPGVLFKAVSDKINERYPISRRKAELTALDVLEVIMEFYEKVAAEEEDGA